LARQWVAPLAKDPPGLAVTPKNSEIREDMRTRTKLNHIMWTKLETRSKERGQLLGQRHGG